MASSNAQSPNYRAPSQQARNRLVVRDEIAFQKQLAAQLASERSFTLGLFPTHELPGFAAESQAGDLYEDSVVESSRALLSGLTIPIEEFDEQGNPTIAHISAESAFSRMEKLFFGASSSCFLRVTMHSFVASDASMFAVVVRMRRAIGRGPEPLLWLVAWQRSGRGTSRRLCVRWFIVLVGCDSCACSG